MDTRKVEDDRLEKEERLQRVRKKQLGWEAQQICTYLLKETLVEVT